MSPTADGTCERGAEVVDSERTDFQVDDGDATCGNEVRQKANMHKGEERKVNDTTPPKAAQHSTQQNRKDEDNDCWHCTGGSGSDIGECTEM